MRRARLIVADDHVLLLDAIKSLLAARFEVVGTFTDGLALVNGAAELKPNVILLDIGMPNLSGLSAGERLKQILPNVKLVYLTMNLDVEVAAEAFRLGASAYVVKSSAATELIQAIELALVDRSYVTPLITKEERPDKFFYRVKQKRSPNHLTLRQREVLQLLAEGRNMKEVAYILNVAPRTVAFHKYKMMELLHLRNHTDLLRFALNSSLVAVT
jgi:DNA-binding NarL/FixJ family response regulator